jgi:glycosyltransferase involved in cell wall biosynthesis
VPDVSLPRNAGDRRRGFISNGILGSDGGADVGQKCRAETMSILSKLQSIGVKLCSDIPEIDCDIFEPTPGLSPVPPALLAQPDPLVSCLMITRGNVELMKYSLACYRRQTYAHRELVIVAEPDAGERVRAFIASQEAGLRATVFVAPPGLTIGDHRNLAVARARGAIIVNWDDDDLSDPRRIGTSVNVLRQTGVAAVFLSRVLLWWPRMKIAAITGRRSWEQSIAAWRSYMPLYAPLPRAEDTAAVESLVSTHRVARVDCPFLYVYAVTGKNTWRAPHFESMLPWADCVFEGDQFDELNELLSDRLPTRDYAAFLNADGVIAAPLGSKPGSV